MSDKERAIEVLEQMPADVSLQEILEALNLMFDINNRIDNFDIDNAVTTIELLKDIKTW